MGTTKGLEWRRAQKARWLKATRRLLYDRYNNRCNAWDCGSFDGIKGRLEFAHVRPTGLMGRGRGRWERLLDVLHNPTYYTLMHRTCHKRYDDAGWERRRKELESAEAPF